MNNNNIYQLSYDDYINLLDSLYELYWLIKRTTNEDIAIDMLSLFNQTYLRIEHPQGINPTYNDVKYIYSITYNDTFVLNAINTRQPEYAQYVDILKPRHVFSVEYVFPEFINHIANIVKSYDGYKELCVEFNHAYYGNNKIKSVYITIISIILAKMNHLSKSKDNLELENFIIRNEYKLMYIIQHSLSRRHLHLWFITILQLNCILNPADIDLVINNIIKFRNKYIYGENLIKWHSALDEASINNNVSIVIYNRLKQ